MGENIGIAATLIVFITIGFVICIPVMMAFQSPNITQTTIYSENVSGTVIFANSYTANDGFFGSSQVHQTIMVSTPLGNYSRSENCNAFVVGEKLQVNASEVINAQSGLDIVTNSTNYHYHVAFLILSEIQNRTYESGWIFYSYNVPTGC